MTGDPSRGSGDPPFVERRRDEPNPAAVAFVMQLARALHTFGHSAGRLEDILGVTSDRLGMPAHQFFSTPTSIMASFGAEARQRTYLVRVEPGEVNLGRLAALERVALDVAAGRTPPQAGTVEIARIVAARPPYGPLVTTIAHGAVSGASCVFLGGGAREIAVASVLGLGLGVLSLLVPGHPRLGRVFEPLAAFLVSAAAIALARVAGPLSVLVATISGLVVLLPGFTLTTAMSELATRHLASGTARLSGASMTFLATAFGVALGNQLGAAAFGAAFGAAPAVEPGPLPWWAILVALVVAPLCFTVILRADRRDAPWIVAAGALGYAGGRVGAATLGAELGAFAGAFAVALAGAAYEWWRRRPAAVVVVPGILLLVPGSVGFRSLLSLMDRKAVAGIETAFSMIMTAVALAAGLLVAAVVAPEPRVGNEDRVTGNG